MAKERQPLIKSPFGALWFNHLHEPDQYKGKGEFNYRTNLVLQGDEATKFKDDCDGWMQDAAAELKAEVGNPPYREWRDKGGNPVAGALSFSFKLKGDWGPIAFGDKKGNTVDPHPVGNGSTGFVYFNVYKRTNTSDGGRAGVTLQIRGVQIGDLVSPAGVVEFSDISDELPF